MKNRLYILALTLGLAPCIALGQNQNYPYPPDRQQTDHDRGMQRQDRDDQQRVDRDDQQRTDQDRDRESRRTAGDVDRMLRDRFPNTNISVNHEDNNTVVMTGTAATGHDRKGAEDFVRSQLGSARVIDQVQVTGRGPEDRDRDTFGQQIDRDRDQRVDRDQDNRVPQGDVDNRTDRDRDVKDRDRDHVKDNDKDRDKHNDKDKKHKKDKDRDKDRDRDRDERPY